MTTPLYGFLEGDSIGLLLLAQEEDRIEDLTRMLQAAAGVRVEPRNDMSLWFDGRRLDNALTVKQAALSPLDVVHVRRSGAPS